MAEGEKYFKDGDAYERLMGRWSRVVGTTFLDWLSLPDGLKWVDVGCGTGAFTECIVHEASPAAIGALDPSEDQIAYARSREAGRQVDYRVGDAQSLPFDDGEFDVSVMALAINFIPDPGKAASEMSRVVRPGGTVATYMWDLAEKLAPMQPLFDGLERVGIEFPGIRPEITRLDALQALFGSAGLEDVRTRVIEIQLEFADFDDFWVSSTGLTHPAVKTIMDMPADELARFKDVLRALLSTDEGGAISYPARANAVKGYRPH